MKLKELRKAAGVTQTELAEKVGVKQSTIAMLETGKNKSPRIEVAKKICKVLGCTMDELYAEQEEEHEEKEKLKSQDFENNHDHSGGIVYPCGLLYGQRLIYSCDRGVRV